MVRDDVDVLCMCLYSVYNTQAMQHFVVSMEGQPASYLPRDLLRGLSRDLLRGLADVLYQSRPLLVSL